MGERQISKTGRKSTSGNLGKDGRIILKEITQE
jgi:hypothetical protein